MDDTGFRRQLPTKVILTRGLLRPSEAEEREGYRVATPLRTPLAMAGSPTNWPSLDVAVNVAVRNVPVASFRAPHHGFA